MKLAPWHLALGGGLLGAGVVLTFAVKRKVGEFEVKGRALEAGMAGAGGASQVRMLQQRLEAYAATRAPQIATAAGDAYMRDTYGVTAQRIQALEALGRRLGV